MTRRILASASALFFAFIIVFGVAAPSFASGNPGGNALGSIVLETETLNGTGTINVSNGQASRDYKITITNYWYSSIDLNHIIDLLPQFENLDLDPTKAPKLTLKNPNEEPDETYDLYYDLMPDFREPGSVYDAKRVMFDAYESSGGRHELSLGPAIWNVNGDVKPFIAEITFSTTVDLLAAADFLDKESLAVYYANWNKVGLYPVMKNLQSSSAMVIEDERAGTDWDDDPTTHRRFTSNLTVNLMNDSTAPYVGVKPYTILTDLSNPDVLGEYTPASIISPNQPFALKINFGNSNITGFKGVEDFSVSSIAPGSVLVVELPPGMAYDGFQKENGSTVLDVPDYIGGTDSEPIVYKSSATGRTSLIWYVGREISEGSGTEIYIRVTGSSYLSNNINAYYIPTLEADTHFYDDIIRASAEFTGLPPGYYSDTLDMKEINLGEAMHLVRTSTGVSVFGELGLSAKLSVTEIEPDLVNTVSSTDDNRILTLTDRAHSFRYTMDIETSTIGYGLTNPAVINRLPGLGDDFVLGNDRGSKASVGLAGDYGLGDILFGVYINNEPDADFRSDDWLLEFFTGTVDGPFEDADWNGTETDPNRWLTADEIGTQSVDPSTLTAFRILYTKARDYDYIIPPGYTFSVGVTAKLTGDPRPYKVALDSFAFRGSINDGVNNPFELLPVETPTVGVMAGNLYDSAVITKILNDPSYPPRSTGPFYLELIGANSNSPTDTKTRGPYAFTVYEQADGTWSASIIIENLSSDYVYSVEEKDIPNGYVRPLIQENPVSGQGYSTVWNFTVTNAPVLYWVTYHANGGSGSQNDDGNLYYFNDDVSVKDRGSMNRSGYSFIGWSTSANGVGEWYRENQKDAFKIKNNTTLYAQWRWNGYTGEPDDPGQGHNTDKNQPNKKDPVKPDDEDDDEDEEDDTLLTDQSQTGGGSSTDTAPLPGTVTTTVPDESGDIAKFSRQTGNPVKDLFDGNVPFGNANRDDCWSLISMILGIVGIVLAITTLFKPAMQNMSEGETEEKTARKIRIMRIIAIIVCVLVLAVWLLLDNLLLPQALINKWTPYVFAVFIIGIVMVLVQKRMAKTDSQK